MTNNKKWTLSRLLKATSLSKSTYYFEISKADKDVKNQVIIAKIEDIFEKNKGRYGSRRVTAELRNNGYLVNHKKVSRLMSKLGLKAIQSKQKYHSYLGQVGHIAENIINRDFKATKPNEKWTTDVSQFNCPFGKCYLSPIIDMGMGDVVAWDLSLSPNLEQTKRMLNVAFKKYPNLENLIFHSDMGWQYQHGYYRQRLKEKGIIQSMSRKGNCLDNSVMESFFGVMKNEMFYGHEKDFKTFEQFKHAVAKYMDYYNNYRIKIKTKWMPPSKFREASMLGNDIIRL